MSLDSCLINFHAMPQQTILDIPTTDEEKLFSTSYNYCTANWCIRDEYKSAFTYGTGESFSSISKCNEPYIDDIESQVANPPQNMLDICGNSIACLVDGLCGSTADAREALSNEGNIRWDQEEHNPQVGTHAICYIPDYFLSIIQPNVLYSFSYSILTARTNSCADLTTYPDFTTYRTNLRADSTTYQLVYLRRVW